MRLFVLIGGLIVAVLMAALIVPIFIDWGTYRDRFETEASRLLGQPVTVAGNASAKLLPFPSVTFTDVRVGPDDAPNITIEEFSMDAELAPFLSGELLIFDMRLTSPVIRLDMDEDGLPQWQWPSQSPIDPAQISLENATFTDGTIVLRDAAQNRHWDFVSLNGSAAADNLFGPWRVEGEGLIAGLPFSGRLSTGSLTRTGFATRVAAMLPTNNLDLSLDGRIAPPNDDVDGWFTGDMTIKPIDVDGTGYIIDGAFVADGRGFHLPDFRGAFGDAEDPYIINGSIEVVDGDTPSFDLSAKGNQLNLNAPDQNAEPIALDMRLKEIGETLNRLPLPPIAGQVNLDLPAVIIGSTTLRDVVIVAEREDAGWKIDAASAKLPGRTVLEGNGILKLNPEPRFDGKLVLASRQPSGLAAWLTDDVDEAIRLLPRAGFGADVSLSSTAQNFEQFELILGEASLSGNLYRQSDGSKLPAIALELFGENTRFETIEALAATFFDKAGAFRLADHDVDVSVDLRDSRIADMPIGGISADMRIRGQRTEIDRLAVNAFFGASISATGTLVRSADPSNLRNTLSVDASLIWPQGTTFLDGLSTRFGDNQFIHQLTQSAERNPSIFDETALNLVGSFILPDDGEIEGSASISGQTGGSSISLTTSLKAQTDDLEQTVGQISGTVENPETGVLLSQAGFDILPIRQLGPGRVEFLLSGDMRKALDVEVSLETADVAVSGSGVLAQEGTEPLFNGLIEVVAGDAEPWMDVFGYIFPSTGLGTPMKGTAALRYLAGEYQFSDMSGDIAGNRFSGTVNLSSLDEKPEIAGTLTLDNLDAAFIAGIATGRYDISDPDQLFNRPLYADHDVDLQIQATSFGAEEANLADAEMRLVYRDASMSIQGFKARLGKGQVAGSLDVQNNNGNVLVNGQIGVSGSALASLWTANGNRPRGRVNLAATFAGSGNNVTALLNAMSGSGAATARGIQLSGLGVDGIAPLLKQADAIGYEITDAQINGLAEDLLSQGEVSLAPMEIPLSISNGQIKASKIAVSLGDAQLTSDIAYTLMTQTVSGSGRLSYMLDSATNTGARPEYDFAFSQSSSGAPLDVTRDYQFVTSFVRQRALEREQARVEALQARLVEKQRLRRQVRYLRYQQQAALAAEQERLRLEREEAERAKQERLAELERQRLAQQAAEQAEERAKKEAEEKARQDALEAKERADALERQATQELRRTLIQRRGEDDAQPTSRPNPTDQSLIEDPLAPIPDAGAIFENLDLGLGN